MKAALSIVLAGLLVTLPLKHILAQAEQQAPQASVADTIHTETLIGVPWIEPGSNAALLLSVGELNRTSVSDSIVASFSPRRLSTGASVAIVVVAVLAVVALIVYLAVCADLASRGPGC